MVLAFILGHLTLNLVFFGLAVLSHVPIPIMAHGSFLTFFGALWLARCISGRTTQGRRERQALADRTALEVTGDREAAVSAIAKMTTANANATVYDINAFKWPYEYARIQAIEGWVA